MGIGSGITASYFVSNNEVVAIEPDGKMNVSVDISNVIFETKRLIIRHWKNENLNDF